MRWATAVRRPPFAWTGAVVALLLAVGLAVVAGFPTGAAAPHGVVPSGARVAAEADVAGGHVLLTVEAGELVLRVAYRGAKGWHDVAADPVAGHTVAAWTSTSGGEGVPAVSAVYGRAPGSRATVVWRDGASDTVDLARDGAYLVARPGGETVDRVVVLDEHGATVEEVTDL